MELQPGNVWTNGIIARKCFNQWQCTTVLTSCLYELLSEQLFVLFTWSSPWSLPGPTGRPGSAASWPRWECLARSNFLDHPLHQLIQRCLFIRNGCQWILIRTVMLRSWITALTYCAPGPIENGIAHAEWAAVLEGRHKGHQKAKQSAQKGVQKTNFFRKQEVREPRLQSRSFFKTESYQVL